MPKINVEDKFFYLLFLTFLILVLFTNPFLRFPYDMYHHLIEIDKLSDATSIPHGRQIWHFFWAKFFSFVGVETREIFLRAKIIHIVQVYISIFCIYFFSNVVIRNIFKDLSIGVIRYLSLQSVIIWLTIFATFSVNYHLVWSLWYSVNYQVTLPLFWYMSALTLVLLLEDTSNKKKLFFILQILLLSRFILQAHSMEFMYYLMYIIVISIIFIDKLFVVVKKYFLVFLLIIGLIIYFINTYMLDNSKIFDYMSIDKVESLYQLIMQNGAFLVTGANRAYASINELMYTILFVSIFTILLLVYKKMTNNESIINTKMYLFILITSLFVLIPVNQFSVGLFSIINRIDVVHRIYYSSSLFVLLPISMVIILRYFDKISIKAINISFVLVLFLTFIYSKYNTFTTHNYYKNVLSIQNSFFDNSYKFHLSQKEIDLIGEQVSKYEAQNKDNSSKLYYYARPDIAFVLKYIYRKDVYFLYIKQDFDYLKAYEQKLLSPDYKDIDTKQFLFILFQTPADFSEYVQFM